METHLYFDSQHLPDAHGEFVAWCDGMGTGQCLSRSLHQAANSVFKLHSAFSIARQTLSAVRCYPVMDGVYVTSPTRGDMQKILKSAFGELAREFINRPGIKNMHMMRAGFVMANSASDARGSELEIRKKLIKDRAVDVIAAVGSNFFYTVTLPCTLWFLDRGKKDTDRADKVLFIDSRDIYQQVDRAHREFTPEQVEFLGNIARLYRRKAPENLHGSAGMMAEKFPDGAYRNVPGLCRVATIKEIKAQGWG
jgi:hypothetical protein